MNKEQFLDKWRFGSNPLFEADLDAVIATEIAKVKVQPQPGLKFKIGDRLINFNKGARYGNVCKLLSNCPFELYDLDARTYFNTNSLSGYELYTEPAEQPELNPIEQAYERGEKIRQKNWLKNAWIQKLSKTESTSDTLTTFSNNWDFITHPEKWELYTEPAEQPEMTEKEKIDHILTNKLTWKPMGNKRFYANWFSAESNEGYRQVHFVDYNNPHSGYFETRIFTIDLSEWQPVDTSIKPTEQPAKPFDKDRFERMFRAVVASGRTESWKEDFRNTEIALEKLDAYYASKEGGNNG